VRLIGLDTDCRNTVAILVVGGGEGNTTSEDITSKANQFLNVAAGHRVPVHVIAFAPITATDRNNLQLVASRTGGKYTEITLSMVDSTTSAPALRAGHRQRGELRNLAGLLRSGGLRHRAGRLASLRHGDGAAGDEPDRRHGEPGGRQRLGGAALPLTNIENPNTGTPIPQRSNIMITSGFSLPGFGMKMTAVRTYRPVADSTKPIGYKFVSDGTKLWDASTPTPASRNIYTSLPDGTLVAFTTANATTLRPYLRAASDAAASALIDYIRNQPLGAIVDSTPAIMDPPSLDPPPDADYPGFAADNEHRRSMVWVGANDGMLHGIDARLGKEVWAFIPFNLLPKLVTLKSGQPVGDFRYFVDGSPKVADVKVGGNWRTYLVMGQGPGGTFYQTFDVTLPDMANTVAPDSDSLGTVLSYFSSPSSVPLKWAFPAYSQFNHAYVDSAKGILWGDLFTTAPAVSKTVGQTWSDPAVGQVSSAVSQFVVLTGSGFFPYTAQTSANRGNVVAGNTFYVLSITNGSVLDSRSIGSDNQGETVDNCASASVNNCKLLKNALQADPVATGPADSRYITKAYLGDLDGKIWRFDLNLNNAGIPLFNRRSTCTPSARRDSVGPASTRGIAAAPPGQPLLINRYSRRWRPSA
jgi:hypothetical protein